MLNGGSL
ncbi:hypothetical protein VTH06DRAFT_5711 [Thermothelomyces fergusii]